MSLSLVALGIFIFGAYAYGSVVVLTLRQGRPVWAAGMEPARARFNVPTQALVMYAVCTLWFVLHTVMAVRLVLGDPWDNDLIDLAALELVFAFPALIFHTVLLESESEHGSGAVRRGVWMALLFGLYAAGAALAIYFPAAIFGAIPAPARLSPYAGMSVGALFSISSAGCLMLMAGQTRPGATRDQRRLHKALMGLFVSMIVVFLILSFVRRPSTIVALLDVGVRTTPLLFLLVSVYFGNRIEFYDLVIKRGVIMLLSLVTLGAVLLFGLGWLDQVPAGPARPWLFAVVLLPLAMALPWMHDRVGRLLDRLWFGREFTPVEAIKHVLGGMQQATDEASLVAATEATLSDMFRRPVRILLEPEPLPADSMVATSVATSWSAEPIRFATSAESSVRPLLSEDLALLRSRAGVFGFMLENVRLQRRRQEQEQLAHDLRLQTSRSELKALRAQINPHFLFNALNAIASLIHTDPTRADAAVEQLAEVFRYTLRRSEQEWAPLDQELALARAYLDVEQARFGRRLEFAIETDPAVAGVQVPSMLLQTLVENAVKHGISQRRSPGRIVVSAARSGDQLSLEVRDTGPGPDARRYPSPASGESFGLRSIRDRLQGHFGTHASLELVREAHETVARIRLPLIQESAALGAPR